MQCDMIDMLTTVGHIFRKRGRKRKNLMQRAVLLKRKKTLFFFSVPDRLADVTSPIAMERPACEKNPVVTLSPLLMDGHM